ncbi:MAG: ATP-binding protein [Dissulfurispiraceae bacterium]|jgi:PAS domain S-box-containing protein
MENRVVEVTVLYVEDDPNAREAASEILKRIVRTVYVAENGKDGLEAFKQHNPDIVITDIKMPVMSGLEMARKIREESINKQIIVITAHSDTDYLLSAIDIAVDQYILKPVQSDRLIAAVRKCAGYVLHERESRKYNDEREKLILELQEANAANEQQLRFTETLLEAIPIAAFYKDTEGRYLGCNNEFAEIIGITPEDIVGKTVFDLWPAEQAHTYHQKDKELLQNPAYQIYEYKVTTHEGQSIDVICHKDVFRDKNGLVRGIIGTFLDITERKQAEEKLLRVSEELKQSNEALEQFARDASHDLQEPLISVAVALKLLQHKYKDARDPEAEDYINQSMSQITHMQTLIKELLDYARMGTRKKKFELIGCSTVLDRALANLKGSIEKNETIVTRDSLPEIMCNRTQMTRLFQNLISNAIKFRGEEPLLIHVSAQRKEKKWVFSVRDNGIGIEPKDIENVFKVFHRSYHQEEQTGTGIGLATCEKVVELHRGRIWVESTPNNGSTFYFTIPDGDD